MATNTTDIIEPSINTVGPLPGVGSAVCEACGGPRERGDRFCPFCGAGSALEREAPEAIVPKHFQCSNCGAEVQVSPDTRSYTCAFCESAYVVEIPHEATGRDPPEFVIGFAVDLDVARERFRQWFRRRSWFQPSDLGRAEIVDQLRGVYVPFWSFTLLAQSRWSANIGEYWYRTERYTTVENGKTVTKTRTVRETEWWTLQGKYHSYYWGYLISASRGLPHTLALKMQPYALEALKRYHPRFLAGWAAEEYSVARDEALRVAMQEFRQRQEVRVAAHLPGDTYSGLRVETEFSKINSDLILLPVYMLRYRYRGKEYRFVMNGQTGATAGTKPISPWRVGAAIVLVGAVLGVALALAAMIA